MGIRGECMEQMVLLQPLVVGGQGPHGVEDSFEG